MTAHKRQEGERERERERDTQTDRQTERETEREREREREICTKIKSDRKVCNRIEVSKCYQRTCSQN